MKKTKSNPDSNALRVLILEDNPADAELIEHELRRAGIVFTSRLVEGKREYNKALADFRPQVILSDFKLPTFDGLAALEIACTQAPDVPFIFVSGSIGEEKAIEMLAQGASDYIFKDNLQRLVPAVKRMVEATRLQLEKKNSDEKLLHHVEELRLLAEAAEHFVQINDLDEMYEYLAQVIRDISGADYLLLSLYDDKLLAIKPKIVTGFKPFRETMRRRFQFDPLQMVLYLKDMRKDDFSDFVSRRLLPVRDGLYGLVNRKLARPECRSIEKLLAIGTMFTMGFSWENQLYGGLTVFFKEGNELKNHAQIETLLNQAAVAIKRLLAENSLRASEERFRHISTTISDISYSCLLGPEGDYSLSWMTGAAERITGYTIEEIMAMKCWGKLVLAEDLPDFEKHVNGLTAGNNGNCELRLRHKNGNIIWVQSFAECAWNPEQSEQSILYGGLMDISERKNMYEQLRQSGEYYRTLVDTSPDAIVIVDAGGRVTFASPKTFDLFGVPAKTTIEGISILDFVEPGEVAGVQGRMVEILSGRSLPEIREYRLLRHDRSPFWGEISSSPLRDAAGRNVGLLFVCRDVSERKQAEIQIQYQANLLANVSDAILATDRQFKIQYWNAAAEKQYGWTAAEVLGSHFLKIIQPQYKGDSRITVMKMIVQNGFWKGELLHNHRNGAFFPVQATISAVKNAEGHTIGHISINRDITASKRAETIQHIQYKIANAMVTAETFFNLCEIVRKELSALLDTTNFLIALYDEASGMLSAPFEKDEKDTIPQWPAEKSLTGLVIRQKQSVLLSKEQIQLMSQAGTIELIGSRAKTWLGVPLLINEKVLGAIVVQSYDNADAYGQSSINIMEMIASQLSVYIERKRTELELQESEARYRAFFNTSRDCVYITSVAGRWLYMNDAAVELFGYSSREELSQVNILDLYAYPEERAKQVNIVTELGYTKESPVDLRKKDGAVIHALITEVSRYDTDGNVIGFQGTIRDVTERKKDEEQISAALKEKEVLLQEIHHRVKNNLQIISGLLTLQAEQSAGKSLDDIFRASQDRIRSIALIHEKLYRSQNLAEIAFDEYLRDLTENLFISHGIAAGRITAKYEMEAILFTIEKAIPLGLIVNELVTNALKHAFPAGQQGEIHIGLHGYEGAKSYTLKTDSGTLHVIPTCELIVADDGVGLPDGFEPDTKKSLGMNLVSMLAKQIQAELKVKTGPGTEFRLLFPGLPAKEAIKNKEHGG